MLKRIGTALTGTALVVGLGAGATAWAAPDRSHTAWAEPGRPRSPEQQAAREALRECLRAVRQAHPDADRAERRELARPCLEQAGVEPGRAGEKRRACVAEVRRDHPEVDRRALRPLVKECLAR